MYLLARLLFELNLYFWSSLHALEVQFFELIVLRLIGALLHYYYP